MNNIVCITPKYSISNYNYERIEIDKNWINYFKKFNLETLIINETNLKFIRNLKPRCIVISGGGDIYRVSKKKIDLKRDRFELKLFKLFNKKIPIICVCRGSQLIAKEIYNSDLTKINSHVNKNHYIYNLKKKLNVNSFHRYSINNLPRTFNEIFRHRDYSIELAISNKDKVLLSMFHPERFNRDQLKINKILKSFLK